MEINNIGSGVHKFFGGFPSEVGSSKKPVYPGQTLEQSFELNDDNRPYEWYQWQLPQMYGYWKDMGILSFKLCLKDIFHRWDSSQDNTGTSRDVIYKVKVTVDGTAMLAFEASPNGVYTLKDELTEMNGLNWYGSETYNFKNGDELFLVTAPWPDGKVPIIVTLETNYSYVNIERFKASVQIRGL